ncbi:hypothetical protein R3P38DRAFT_3170170 [Favolaschia claudopus]|uniref:Uncharacterized protein n=1 Tax=Favolaschia claudopus TaxID=2862362 RepID=A0AAW0DUP4_9AGAR
MFSTLTVFLAAAAVAQAASSSASAPNAGPTGNPYIPTSISQTCQGYLTQMDTDADLAKCTSSLLSATAGFAPNGNLTTATKQQITDTLTNICSASFTSSCPQNLITGKLADFYAKCGPELTSSPNAQVKTIYDTVYTLLPLLSTLCSKDNSGEWCVPQANSTSTSALLAPAVQLKVSKRADAVTAYMPNATAIDSNNILFLFLSSSLPKEQLCTDCTAAVLKSYMTFEAGTNYAPGLAQSVLMSGQPALYQAVASTCGSDFLSGAVKAAGSLGQGSGKGASGAVATRGSVIAVLAGALGSAAFFL